jgi:hypothetical protein
MLNLGFGRRNDSTDPWDMPTRMGDNEGESFAGDRGVIGEGIRAEPRGFSDDEKVRLHVDEF